MKTLFMLIAFITTVYLPSNDSAACGCKYLRKCYQNMLKSLLEPDEDECIENVAIGTSTISVFLKAIEKFCSRTIDVISTKTSYENKALYEIINNIVDLLLQLSQINFETEIIETNIRIKVVINSTRWGNESRDVILLDAGQDAGVESVRLALYIIEQLMACEEYSEMIRRMRWVILPCSNPDGLEYVRTKREYWKKNMRMINNVSFGVDVTRNFEDSWNLCPTVDNIFSQDYPGPTAGSENETEFVSAVLNKYRSDIRAYVTFRREGHAILYPYASVNSTSDAIEKHKKKAGAIAVKVNQKAGGVQWFANDSIYMMNGKAQCGHSVDYAFNKLDIPYVFEMRMFLESDNKMLSQFQSLPKGYETSLRTGYFNGIKELFNQLVTDEKKRDDVF